MKKETIVTIICMIGIFILVIVGTAYAEPELSHWDQKLYDFLMEDTEQFLIENGYESYLEKNVENDLALGYCVITKSDLVFHDAKPDTILSNTYLERLEECFQTEMYDMTLVYIGQRSGYELYELIIKWNDPVVATNYGTEIYGIDSFVRFMN